MRSAGDDSAAAPANHDSCAHNAPSLRTGDDDISTHHAATLRATRRNNDAAANHDGSTHDAPSMPTGDDDGSTYHASALRDDSTANNDGSTHYATSLPSYHDSSTYHASALRTTDNHSSARDDAAAVPAGCDDAASLCTSRSNIWDSPNNCCCWSHHSGI